MNIRIIKTEEAYRDAISQAEALAVQDPEPGTKEAEQLELIVLLIEDFERKSFSFDIPDPISAIEFRMEEQGLRQRDLIPILGSRSRVSEVLSRTRPLTLQMIRSISENLGIPTDILIRPNESLSPKEHEQLETNWSRFPFQEMQKRGWIPTGKQNSSKDVEGSVRDFLLNAGKIRETAPLYRRNLKGLGVDSFEDKAKYSTLAWTARILQKSRHHCKGIKKFEIKSLSSNYLQNLATFSRDADGPVKAIKQLEHIGICVVIEPRLPGTLIDGAAMLNNDMQPVIGLTLRYDRIDYFWFTLMHELAHVWKHLNKPNEAFIDRIDADEGNERAEKEANRLAREVLIPRAAWNRSIVKIAPTSQSIIDFAHDVGVHPAIVAGRIRHETGYFNRFAKILGQGSVRKLFTDKEFN